MKRHTASISLPLVLLTYVITAAVTPWLASAQEPLWGGALVTRIDSLAEATLVQGSAAALSIGVKRGGDLLLVKGYGQADIENDVPAIAETVYRIGSITKQFTAAAVMQLVEAGKIGLDDPITKYLPDYPTQGHEVTIRHLLTHTSGIKSYTGLAAWRPTIKLDLTDEELLALFKDEPFDFTPGERFLYNNSGFYLLGVIIEKAGGETYREYLNAHLFGPLGLRGSTYCDERPIIRGRAEGYALVGGELLNDEYLSMNQPGAAGALCSTVPDLLSWTAALRTERVVSAASYRQMTTSGTLDEGSTTGYGFGLVVGDLEGHPSVSHGGGINGFSTMLAHYPDADLDVVVLSNTTGVHPGRIAELIAKWALGIEVRVIGGTGRALPVWTDRDGSEQLLDPALIGFFEAPAFSPDGRRVALQRQVPGESEDIWIYDLEQRTFSQLTFGDGRNLQPFWNPDGTEVGFSSNRDGLFALYSRPADLSGDARLLVSDPDDGLYEASWTPDGQSLVYRWGSTTTTGSQDLRSSSPDLGSAPVVISGTPASENSPSLSPDGRWVAYASDESGQYEVYVRPFPGPGDPSLVSVNGGFNPKWAPNGRELFYLGPDGVFNVATVRTDPDFAVESHEQLDSRAGFLQAIIRHWDLTPDGQRLLVIG